MDDDAPTNEAMREFWNGDAGRKWVAFQTMMDRSLAPFGERAVEAGEIGPGQRVLDVGCGCGDTTFALASRVGAAGAVLGIDISRPMLARARDRAVEAAAGNVEFELADAEVHPLPAGRFDRVFSRFGVMFFVDPAAAFRNFHRALAPGGRLAFVCWRPVAENEWVRVPVGVIRRHVALPAPPGPDDPGEFSFGERSRVERILDAAGFADVAVREFDTHIAVAGGGGAEESAAFLLEMGPASRALADADGGTALTARVTAELEAALAAFDDPAHGVRMGAAAWIVSAGKQ